MTDHRVVWEIDIEADTPEDAAKEALLIQRDQGSDATCFTVTDKKSGKAFEIDGCEF